MEDRKKRAIAPAVLLLALLSVGAYYALRPASPEAAPPTEAAAPQPAATATAGDPGAPSAEPASTASGEPVVAPADPEPGETAAPTAAAATRPRSIGEGSKRKASPEPEVRPAATVAAAAPPPTADAGAPAAPSATAAAEKRPPAASGATVVGQFTNRAGPQFKLLRVTCQLDGQTVYSGPAGASVELFRRSPTPGSHTLSVLAEYQGNGGGVFSYFDGYKFTVRGSRGFNVNPEGSTRVSVTAVERGGALTRHEDRLGMVINVN